MRPALVLVTLVAAGCSVLYELLAAQTLSSLAANTVVWYSVVIGTFLGAMGLGAFQHDHERDSEKSAWRTLLGVELRLCLAGALVVPAIHFGHMMHGYFIAQAFPRVAAVAFFGTAFAMTSLVGYLTGIELPLLMRIGAEESGEESSENLVLGIDYVGSLLGAIAFPLLLLPRFDLLSIGAFAAVLNLAVAAYVLRRELLRGARVTAPLVVSVGLVTGLAALMLGGPRIEQYFLRKYYYYPHASQTLAALVSPMTGFPEIERSRSPYQRIDLMRDVDPDSSRTLMQHYSDKVLSEDMPPDHILFLNGDFQTNTTYEEIYHEYFAHVPIASTGRVPRNVLVMGGGDGYLLRELVKYDGIESILHVDIDPVLPALARTHPVLRAANDGAYEDPRIERMQADGFHFVRNTDRQFDAVYIDFPVAVDYDLARLYSREFFHFVRRRLAPLGFAVFDATGISLLTRPGADGNQAIVEGNDWPIYCNTLMAAGFPQIVPYLTTLEIDNPAAQEWLEKADVQFTVGGEFLNAWNSGDAEERAVLRRILVERALTEHVLSLQQGFVMMGERAGVLTQRWHAPGVPTHVLSQKRFKSAFDVRFPFPDEPDPDLVNSILQPRFPTLPLWMPRKPY